MQAWLLLLPVRDYTQHDVHPSCKQVHTVSALTACMASKPRMRHLLHALHCTLHGQKRGTAGCAAHGCSSGNRRATGVLWVCSSIAEH
jgi:hypothetical protein